MWLFQLVRFTELESNCQYVPNDVDGLGTGVAKLEMRLTRPPILLARLAQVYLWDANRWRHISEVLLQSAIVTTDRFHNQVYPHLVRVLEEQFKGYINSSYIRKG